MTESARATAAIGDALAEGRRKADNKRPRAGTNGLLGLQRLAGNAAVNALLAAKFKSPGGEAVGQIDAAHTANCAATTRRSTLWRRA